MSSIDEWRERLRQARENYTHASAIAAKIQRGQTPEEEVERALRAEVEARDEYMRVLRNFTTDGEPSQ